MKRVIQMYANNHQYERKPTSAQTAIIQNNMSLQDFGVSDIRNRLTSGITIKPAIFDGDSFISQQMFLVDVDNNGEMRRVADNIDLCERFNLVPALIYKTFSGTFENQKHRLCFVTDSPIADLALRNRIQNELTTIFAGDVSATDAKRIFYGGDLCYFYGDDSVVTADQVHEAYKQYTMEAQCEQNS
ncbi:MAG: hypothetical protein UH824_02110 [Acutalibacteraceae bacterium]|nr:hypothetical protein [Acutalibacteraceae bacterium]